MGLLTEMQWGALATVAVGILSLIGVMFTAWVTMSVHRSTGGGSGPGPNLYELALSNRQNIMDLSSRLTWLEDEMLEIKKNTSRSVD